MKRKAIAFAALPLLALVLIYRGSRLLEGGAAIFDNFDDIPPKTLPATTSTPPPQPPSEMKRTPMSAGDKHEDNDKKQNNSRKNNTISVVVRMKGEMSNLISYWVFAKGVQLWANDHYGLTMDLVGERQAGTKWKGAVTDIQTCFPNLRTINFHGGRWDDDFKIRRQQQRDWVGEENFAKLIIDRGDSDCGTEEWFCLHHQLAFLQQILQQSVPESIITANETSTHSNKYSLPYLMTDQQASFDVIVDQYFDQIRDWLAFDYDACCSSVEPDPDEVVFVS
jgi:hypothetical protein